MSEVQHLRSSAWQAINSATVDGTERQRSWTAWTEHNMLLYNNYGSDHKRVDTDKLFTFAVAMREGKYGLGSQVKVQSVERALRHVAQKFILDGHPDPRKSSQAQQSLDLPISRLIKSYRDSDPPPQPKLVLPVSTITTIANKLPMDPTSGCRGRPCHNCFLLPAPGGGIHCPGVTKG